MKKINNHMKRVGLLLVATTMTVVASAQSRIEQLFNELDARADKTLLTKTHYEDNEANPTTYCLYDEMAMKSGDFGKLGERFIKTFSDEKDAYRFYRNTTDMTNTEIKVSYGTNNQYSILFGSHASHNYLLSFFRDSKNPDKRHAYALVWYEEFDKVKILRYHIYGNDPTRVSNQRVITYGSGQIIDDRGYLVTGLGNSEPQINNDVDFMKRFGTLRASMVSANSADDTLLRSGIVVKIVDLCKKHQHLLTDNERATCQKTLAELIKLYSFEDPYIQGMLEEARIALKKK